MRFVLLVAVAAASDFDRALELVTEAQNDCHKPVDLLRTSPRDGGFASGVHTVVAALSQSLLKGRVLTLEAKGHCHQARGRKSYQATPFHDVACAYAQLFEELSPCAAHWRDKGITASRFKLSSPTVFAEHNSTFSISVVNENLQEKPPFFWASVLATYATRPLPCLSKRVDFLEKALFGDVPPSSVVAVHARVDRAKAKEARTHNTRGYVSRAIAVINAYGYDGLLVCSDRQDASEIIVKDVRRWRPSLKVEVAFTPSGHYQRGVHGSCAKSHALDVAAEILLMARCGFVIGTLSSNIGRLVHELQGNEHRFHDLDGLPAWFLAGDGVVENNVRGFWQHFSNHQNAHCVLKNEQHHRPHCAAATDEKPAGLFVAGNCVAGCGRLDVVAKTTPTTTRSREKAPTAWRSSVPRLGGEKTTKV